MHSRWPIFFRIGKLIRYFLKGFSTSEHRIPLRQLRIDTSRPLALTHARGMTMWYSTCQRSDCVIRHADKYIRDARAFVVLVPRESRRMKGNRVAVTREHEKRDERKSEEQTPRGRRRAGRRTRNETRIRGCIPLFFSADGFFLKNFHPARKPFSGETGTA